MYGEYVKWFHEMALPDETESMLAYVRGRAARAFYMAQEGNPGPVQLNFPFREPLMPDLTLENRWGSHRQTSFLTAQDGIKRLSDDQLNRLLQLCKDKQRGVIVCGPQQAGKDLTAVVELAKQWQLPILADPLSQLRTGSHEKDGIVEGYDAFLKNADIRANLQADFIIRFGAMPVSKSYLFYINEQQDIPQFVIEDHRGHREPTGNRTEMIFADANQLCIDLIARTNTWKRSTEWLEQWKAVNGITKKHVTRNDDSKLTEGSAVRALMEMIPDGSGLYVGNSMAVRDVDTFLMTMNKTVRIHANRGANGIDGMVSSAIGAAAGTMDRMTLLIGDLSFYHDLNGLLNAKHFDLSITILLIHNNGGGIFSFLPQSADQTHFEALFGTPLDIEFEQAITMYGGKHQKVSHVHELRDALEAGYHHKGLSVVEVNTDRQENATWHQELWANIHQDIKHSGVNQ